MMHARVVLSGAIGAIGARGFCAGWQMVGY
jgi:hypothetical protein